MHNKLKEIIAKTKNDLLIRKQNTPPNLLQARAGKNTVRQFRKAMKFPKKGSLAIIAEIKLASPTQRYLGDQAELLSRVKEYEKAGVDAVSIVTEKNFFKGDIKFVEVIKQTTSLPVLQKDFIVDSYQIYEARIAGADAVLIIAKILSEKDLLFLVDLANKVGLEPIVEINGKDDLKKAIATKTEIIAVNARDLDTFEVDIDRACNLLQEIPDNFTKLGFSGIRGVKDVKRYKNAGANGILIGTSLMKAKNISSFLERIRV